MKIVILSSGHPPLDERIFWKFGRSLVLNDYQVIICTSTTDLEITREGIIIDSFEGKNMKKKEKVNYFFNLLKKHSPDLIICCEPLTILPASKFRKGFAKKIPIISDITEWYPENYTIKLSGLNKYLKYLILWGFNIYTSQLVNGMIIGESAKKKRYNFIAPFIKKAVIGYYPILEFFKYSPPPFNGTNITFCYAGLVNFKRGILTLLEICRLFRKRNPDIGVKLKIAGKFESISEQGEFIRRIKMISDFEIQLAEWTEYPHISRTIAEADICFDLRVHNFVHDNSLPIKVFEYMAAGKPFIFTNINPLQEIPAIRTSGNLVNPEDINSIVNIIESYTNNKLILQEHSLEGRRLIEESFNWEMESMKLIDFINSFIGK